MNHFTIGLIAAMPEEIKPLLRQVGPFRRERAGSFNIYRFSLANGEACLIESGMGAAKGAAATRVLIDTACPSVIINFGFAGAVTTGPSVGDLVMANRLFFHQRRSFSEQYDLDQDLSALMEMALTKGCWEKTFQVYRGTFITAGEIVDKGELAGILPQGVANPVLDMETAAVAQVAAGLKIPLIAVRAISDDAGEELGFSLEELTDNELNVRIGRVLWTVARKPWIIPQLLRLARNSKLAGENLAYGVRVVMQTITAMEI